MQFLTDLRVKHQVAPQPADYQGQTLPQFFLAGRMSSYTTGQNLALDLQKNNPFAWDAVAVPRNRQKAYAQASSGHGITRPSKQPAAGWELVKWLAGEEASRLYAARGLVIPALIKVTESDVFSGAGMPTNYGKTWRDALKEARSFGITRRWNDVLATLDKELAPALEGSKPVPDAMRSLKQQVDQILAMPLVAPAGPETLDPAHHPVDDAPPGVHHQPRLGDGVPLARIEHQLDRYAPPAQGVVQLPALPHRHALILLPVQDQGGRADRRRRRRGEWRR